jgi:hypothetical protein
MNSRFYCLTAGQKKGYSVLKISSQICGSLQCYRGACRLGVRLRSYPQNLIRVMPAQGGFLSFGKAPAFRPAVQTPIPLKPSSRKTLPFI